MIVVPPFPKFRRASCDGARPFEHLAATWRHERVTLHATPTSLDMCNDPTCESSPRIVIRGERVSSGVMRGVMLDVSIRRPTMNARNIRHTAVHRIHRPDAHRIDARRTEAR